MDNLTDQEIIRRVQDRFMVAKNGVNSHFKVSNNMNKFLYEPGTSGYITPPDSITPKTAINLYMVAIEQLIALLNDTPVTITVIPKKPDVEFDSIVYQQVLTWLLSRNRWDLMRPITEKNAAIYGTGIIKLFANRQTGIRFKNLDPRYVYIDPTCRYELDDAKYVIEVCPMTKEELQTKYKVDINMDNGVSNEANSQLLTEFNNGEDTDSSHQMINVYEMWTNEGRRTVCTDYQVFENNVKHDWPFLYPYVAFPWYVLPDRIVGRDIITDTEKLLNRLNQMYQNLEVILDKTANPQKLVSTQAGINTDTLTNAPGLVIKTTLPDARGAVSWAPTPNMPSEYFEYIQRLEYYLTMLFGTQDILMGRAVINSNIPSGRSLEELSNSAQTRLREVFRNMKNGLTTLGRKVTALIPLIYTSDQIVRITGADIEVVKDALTREIKRVAKEVAQSGALSPEEIQKGVSIWMQEEKKDLIGDERVAYMNFNGTKLGNPADFDIEVTGGLDTPKNKLDMIAQAKELLMAGKLDLESWLEISENPHKDKILKRNGEFQEFMAWKQQQIMAQQQAAKQGDQPGMPARLPPEEAQAMQTGQVPTEEQIGQTAQ